MKYYITLDVGGTKIKGGVVNELGEIYKNRIMEFDAFSKAPEELVLNNFIQILEKLSLLIDEENFTIAGIGFAFPGPFDYLRGISLITGVDKYESIYKVNIKNRIIDLISKSDILNKRIETNYKMIFLHDIQAFAIGEGNYGMASEYKRVMYVCIGTGAGSAFTIENRIATSKKDNVPENGWIYNIKFKGGIIDDYISVRGLRNLCVKYIGRDIDGKTLGVMAMENNQKALAVFDQFGKNLLEALKEFLEVFRPDCIILGGQISKSYQYFTKDLCRYLNQRNISIFINTDTSSTTMKGIYNRLIRQ